MSYKIAKLDRETQDILEKCKIEFLRHHPEMKKIRISKNKLIYEIGNFYLRN